ncbi:MAG: peptide-methionine (S)-S-oxide reductase [Puniceicoccaceae bacterium]|nr:MAG: peptide-methionine (S)-S-oxide reductase [Puniceicoccaceae bacterium]
MPEPTRSTPATPRSRAVFGAGCFWCVETVFQRLDGVLQVRPGYAGGVVPDPTYEAVCTGETGHAEVVEIEFDPGQVSFEQLLEVFWAIHDPTSLNRQGADVGTQYRSVIFCTDEEQHARAIESRNRFSESGRAGGPIVTEILPAPAFFPAEAYHQDYYNRHPDQSYCRLVIAPKLLKLGLQP